jgi:hypothetical protein
MDKWNIGMMGLKDRGFLYNYLNLMMIVAMPTKIVSDSTFFVDQYSIIPPFHHSNASSSGQGK